jgi:hypothetical protein
VNVYVESVADLALFQTITVTIDGSDLHLISYYTSEDVRSGKLKRPTSRADVMALPLSPHLFRLTNFRNPPKVVVGPDGKPKLVSVARICSIECTNPSHEEFRCESEELESAGVKVEESTYDGSQNPSWSMERSNQASQGNRSYGTISLSTVSSPSVDSSPFYSSPNSTERWVETYNTPHSPLRNEARSQMPWSISPTQLHHNHLGSGRRSGDFGHAECWPPSPSESGNWSAEPYGLSGNTSELFVDQGRARSNGQYHNSSAIQQSRPTEFSHGHSGHTAVSHDPVSQRLTWVLPAESTGGDRGRSSSSRVPFTSASLSQHFIGGGSYASMSQSFSSAWSSSSPSPLESPSSPVFSARGHVGYQAAYNSGSKAEEDFIGVEEYGDF